MKKFILFAFLGLVLCSCSDDDDDNTPEPTPLSETPTAVAAFDGNNYGIYKGIFVGSSGTVLVNINNNNALSATVVIDGTSYNFTTTETVIENQVIEGLTFTSGSMSFDFNVEADGSYPYTSSIVITGHPNANISLVKETSSKIVKCYQGTYTGSEDSGIFNLVISDGNISGLAAASDGSGNTPLGGTVNNNTIMGTVSGGSYTGTINGYNIGGTWQNDDATDTGTWTGTRTM